MGPPHTLDPQISHLPLEEVLRRRHNQKQGRWLTFDRSNVDNSDIVLL